MHEAVFEAGWDADALMPHHRAVVACEHRGRGREVLSLDWTYAHHDRGLQMWGVTKAWDHGSCTCSLRINTAGSLVNHFRVKKF